ncbi:MAG: hypothetical protein ACYDIC_09845 [Desulfobaccales bacterium]
MALEPDKTVTKLLLSSTSHFVGEYRSDKWLLTHAWPDSVEQVHLGIYENPLSRNFYVLAFKHPEFNQESVAVPKNRATGDEICTYLSILFGKRFENHGPIESHGLFHVPSLPSRGKTINPWLPFNSHRPRSDIDVALNFSEATRIAALWENGYEIDSMFRDFLNAAGGFYARALRVAEEDPETAFLHFITCGEILSNFREYEDRDLLDTQMLSDLERIASDMDGGDKIANRVRKRLFQVRRKFVLTVTQLLSEAFYKGSESKESFCALKAEDIDQRVKAAYDLRSLYLHTGRSFGVWFAHTTRYIEEVQLGTPVIEDKKLKKIISDSPTLIGLERIMRFCLLSFIHRHAISLDSRLD